jgi:hypothetical protein
VTDQKKADPPPLRRFEIKDAAGEICLVQAQSFQYESATGMASFANGTKIVAIFNRPVYIIPLNDLPLLPSLVDAAAGGNGASN